MKTLSYACLSLLVATTAAFAATKPSTTSSSCNYDSWISQGNSLASSGQCKKAVGAYTRALLCEPTDPWAYYYRALVRQGLGETYLSQKDFKEAVQLGANNPQFQSRKKPTDGSAETFNWYFQTECVK